MKKLIPILLFTLLASTTLDAQEYPIANGNHSEEFYAFSSSIELETFNDKETDLFLKAKTLVLHKDWNNAATELEKYLKDYPNGKYNDEVLFWLAKTYNTISGDKIILELSISYQEKAAANLKNFLKNHKESLWFNDAKSLSNEISSDLKFKNLTKDGTTIPKLESDFKHLQDDKSFRSTLRNVSRLRHEIALPIIKGVLDSETSNRIKIEFLLSLAHFPIQAVDFLNEYNKNEKDTELKEVGEILFKEIKTFLIPVSINYVIYQADYKDLEDVEYLPDNILIQKTININKIKSNKTKNDVNRLFDGKLSNIEMITYASGIGGSLNKNLKKHYKLKTAMAIGRTSYIGHMVHHFGVGLVEKDIQKRENFIIGTVGFTNQNTIQSYESSFTLNKNRNMVFAVRDKSKVVIIVLEFESDFETELDRHIEPKYNMILSDVMGAKLHANTKFFNQLDLYGGIVDLGEAKLEIPGREGTWTLYAKSLLLDNENNQFIARGAKLFNHLGELVKEASQIIVPADNPEKYKIK